MVRVVSIRHLPPECVGRDLYGPNARCPLTVEEKMLRARLLKRRQRQRAKLLAVKPPSPSSPVDTVQDWLSRLKKISKKGR